MRESTTIVTSAAPRPPFDTNACIHELFETQVGRTPERIAILYGDRRIRYAELNSKANRVAHRLRQVGVGPEVTVGILVMSSVDRAVAVLGILKAGGAYVALPFGEPQKRLAEMIETAGVRFVLNMSHEHAHPIGEGVTLLSMDKDPILTGSPDTDINSCATLDNLAFIRFTSGSTGKPKGVANIHRSITSRLASQSLPDIQNEDICAINTNLGFGSRLFYPLALGATVALVSDKKWKNVSVLAEAMNEMRVTCMYVVPSLLRQLVNARPSVLESLRGLRAITVGGETLSPDIVTRVREVWPQTLLVNTYGSNEIGTTASMTVIDDEVAAQSRSIGRPVINTRIHILNDEMERVQPGSIGEIHVSSAHLARGYVGNAALTAERFVPDPFGSQAGGRLYKTGDLGRYSEDGSIEFLGRADNQVKIRGYRVEPDEVAIALQGYDKVSEAAVRAWDATDGPRLVAYVVPGNDRPLTSTELRAHLSSCLPDYMIPATFVVLSELPRTFNGKVAASKLPPPPRERPSLEVEYEGPRDRFEQAVVEIWQELLEIDRIGIHDNFVELGGDSLLAVQAGTRLTEMFGAEVSLEAMLYGTVAEISDAIFPTLERQEDR